MKRITLIFIFLTLLFSFLNCRNMERKHIMADLFDSSFLNITEDNWIIYDDWQISNDGCYGCSSFLYQMVRTKNPDREGNYYYAMRFYSNGFWPNGNKASVKIWGLFLYINGVLFNKEPVELICNEITVDRSLYFRIKNPRIQWIITWQGHMLHIEKNNGYQQQRY